jgi:hypothetical protein
VLSTEHPHSERHTPFYCLHPYFGYVCRPNAVLDFSDTVPAWFGHAAHAAIDWEGFRNDRRPAEKPGDELWIGVFGGSVAFSAPSTNNSTSLSAFLERELNARRAAGARRVRVINFALPAGQQPQQAIIFLTHAGDLDGIITFDGVNEAIIAPYYNRGGIPDAFPYRPIYEPLYARTLTDEQTALSWAIEEAEQWTTGRPAFSRFPIGMVARRRIASLRRRLRATEGQTEVLRSLFQRTGPADTDQWLAVGARRWREMIMSMNAIAQARHVSRLFVLQPVPERNKSLTPNERAGVDQYPDMIALRTRGYPQLESTVEALSTEGIPCMSFKTLFEGCSDTIYTDHIHFEDRGCEIAAARLAEVVTSQWPCLTSHLP